MLYAVVTPSRNSPSHKTIFTKWVGCAYLMAVMGSTCMWVLRGLHPAPSHLHIHVIVCSRAMSDNFHKLERLSCGSYGVYVAVTGSTFCCFLVWELPCVARTGRLYVKVWRAILLGSQTSGFEVIPVIHWNSERKKFARPTVFVT